MKQDPDPGEEPFQVGSEDTFQGSELGKEIQAVKKRDFRSKEDLPSTQQQYSVNPWTGASHQGINQAQ